MVVALAASLARTKDMTTHICRYGVRLASHDVQNPFMEVVRVLAVAAPPSPALAHNAMASTVLVLHLKAYYDTASKLLPCMFLAHWRPILDVGNHG